MEVLTECNLHMEVHKVLCLPRNLHVKKQVHTLITMEGRTSDHRRQPQKTANNATARSMEVHKVLRLPRILHMEVHKALRLPRILRMEVHKVLRLPGILHMQVHKVLRLPRVLRVKKQVHTLITMEGRTSDHRRQPQTTADNATPTASNRAWRFTKCCACHEFCTWRFTKCCAGHEFCASTNK